MATTLKARSGSALHASFKYDDSTGVPKDTAGYQVRMQLRERSGNRKVLPDIIEGSPELELISAGRWKLFLGKTYVSRLPEKVSFEVELINLTNEEDTIFLGAGIILTEPEVTKNV